jgi:Leucine-rich repeat (LRR) protein
MAENALEALPDWVGKLWQLRELHLRNNRLTGLPEGIGELKHLRQLDLRGNPLVSLPEALLRLPRLEKLDLRWVTGLEEPMWLGVLEGRGCLVYR